MVLVVVPGTIDFEQLAEAPNGNGQLLLGCVLDDGMSLL